MAVFDIILEILSYLIGSVINTSKVLIGLFGKLIGSLIPAAESGIGGTILAGIILFIVGYFILKLIFKSSKTLMILLILAIVIVLFLTLGNVF